MASIEFKDDCLAPNQYIYLEYSGSNPLSIYKRITEILQRFFIVSSSGMYEDDFRWDNVGPEIGFYIRIRAERKLSSRSKLHIKLVLDGKKKKDENKGNFRLRVESYIETAFSYKNPISKAILWAYIYFFYGRVKKEYQRYCHKRTLEFVGELKKFYNLQTHENKIYY